MRCPHALPPCVAPPQVRAGVRNPEKADTFLEIASSYGLLSKDELGRLTVRRGFEGHVTPFVGLCNGEGTCDG